MELTLQSIANYYELHFFVNTDRKKMGAFYTPKKLTEEIIKHTVDPLVKNLNSQEILKLKICDVAVGSGAFLVQCCRYLGGKLVEAWQQEGKELGEKETEILKAKRMIAQSCLYGVDKNPQVVEMAKLSLWLETLEKDKAFTFLDHAIKVGDSLVGVEVNQLLAWDLEAENLQGVIGGEWLKKQLAEVIELRQQIESQPDLSIEKKHYLLSQATARVNELKTRADLLIGSYLIEGKTVAELKELRKYLLLLIQSGGDIQESLLSIKSQKWDAFHWQLEFPEVFLTDKGGFDGIVSNPPFMGGSKITGYLGNAYREYLVNYIAQGKRAGQTDLCAYFFLRVMSLLREGGCCGLVATNTISQGDTREVGLERLLDKGVKVYRAISSAKWEGTANLEVSHIWMCKGRDNGYWLDGQEVEGITPYLTIPGRVVGKPYRLVVNNNNSFLGSQIYGQGFVLTPDAAMELIAKDEKNRLVLFPYLNGKDLNTDPSQSPSRWVINFHDWGLSREDVNDLSPVAADFPDCLDIVERLVKPEREKLIDRNAIGTKKGKMWWLYGSDAKELYKTIRGLDRVLIRSRVSNTNSIAFVPTNIVLSEATVIFAFDDYANFAILQSMTHTEWLIYHSSTLGAGIRYTPSDCFDTFPFPGNISNLEEIGNQYYQHRQQIMSQNQEGLTKTYNRFHSPQNRQAEIITLRELHTQMDTEVSKAYCWDDLDLQHDFHQTKQGLRFTVSESARGEILSRLLELNHLRYHQEVSDGLHKKVDNRI